MHSIAYNLELFELILEEFNGFLLSKETFWPLGVSVKSAGPPLPRLSLGQTLLTMDELQVQAELMSPPQIQHFQALSERFDTMQEGRPANLEKKAVEEHRQRANLWIAYISDLHEGERVVESYSQDVTHRVLVNRLRTFITDLSSIEKSQDKIESADGRLRAVFQKGGFIWHPRLKPLYGRSEYWFLYGRPVQQK